MVPTNNRDSRKRLARAVVLGAMGALLLVPAMARPQPSPKADEAGQISDKEKLSRAAANLDTMRSLLKEVLKRLEEARNEKDVVKLNCVNENLTQLKGLVRVAEQSEIALQEDIAKGDEANARHEYAKIDLASQRTKQLRADAEQCIGQLAYVVDENTLVTVEVPEDLPDPDTTTPSLLTALNPPVLSPTQ
jgi:hypothetical protein